MKDGEALLREIEKAFKKEDVVSLVKTDTGDIVVIPGEVPPSDDNIFDEDESC